MAALVFVNRPNQQRNREEDASMVRVLLNGLPKSLDDRWKPRWTTGATLFHNGQILLTPKAVWISMHSVEFRALELLGIDHVPVETIRIAGRHRALHRRSAARGERAVEVVRPTRAFRSRTAAHAAADRSPRRRRRIRSRFDRDASAARRRFDRRARRRHLPRRETRGAAPANDWQELEKTYSLAANAAMLC